MSKRRYPRSASIQNAKSSDESFYAFGSGGADNGDSLLKNAGMAMGDLHPIERATASRYLDYSDLAPNVSGRPGLTQQDYYRFRPSEATPVKQKDIMGRAEVIYQRVGLVKNVIDLMGDFGSHGIRVVHPNKRIEKLGRNWFKGRKGRQVSERFLNYFYRHGNVVVRRMTATITPSQEDKLYKSIAAPDMEIEKQNITKREIPWKYVFLNPCSVELLGGSIAAFNQKPKYGLVLPHDVRRTINSPRTPEEREIVASLPHDIKSAAKQNRAYPLDADKLIVYHYKKDDWNKWAYPMIYGIMNNISHLEKLQLADMAALDGAISNIRIFTLGSVEHKIFPTKAAFAKLSEMLENHTGVGTIDIVWGPDLKMQESKSNVYNFLGEEKYKSCLNQIYAGLGIPPTLTGTFGAAGTTNNFVSLKTLVQRLEYGREALRSFWENELTILQKALGIRFAFKIEFEHMDLGDSDAEKTILIQLADRNLISDELLQYHFGHDPEMEKIRINRESKERESGRMVPKAGGFHDPQFEIALKKIALQSGVSTPSQVGLDLPKAKNGEKPALEMKAKAVPPGGKKPAAKKKAGVSGQGRPKTSKDTKTRKTKTFKPKVKAALEVWTGIAQEQIADTLNDTILEHYGRKNMRSLTAEEQVTAEEIKFGVLCQLEPFSPLDVNTISAALEKGGIPQNVSTTYRAWANDIGNSMNRKLSVDELRKVQASVYIHFKEELNGEDNG